MNAEQLKALRTVLEQFKGAKEDYEANLEAMWNGNYYAGMSLENHLWPSLAVLHEYLDSQEAKA